MMVAAAVFLPMAILYHPATGWNVNTRLALLFAVADRGTFSIDGYHEDPPMETEDKAFFDGKHYSDKIFGVTLLALPAYWLGQRITGERIRFHGAHFLVKAWAVALPGGIAAGLFFLLLARTGTPPRLAIAATAAAVFGTLWFGYGSVFFPYVPGIACALGALFLTLFPPARRLTIGNCLAVGFLLGYALLCDLLFAFTVFGIGVIWLMRLLDQLGVAGSRAFAEMAGERSRLRETVILSVVFWVGVLIPVGLFAAYCYSIFGRVSLPYEYEVNERFREGMSRGLMGATMPKAHALWFLTLHPFRGIFFWSPVVVAALAGCALGLRQYGKRWLLGALGLWCFVSYLVFNAGYYMWWGGWGMGPRFLLPGLPFALLGIGELLREGKLSAFERRPSLAPIARRIALGLGALSIAMSLPVSIYDPQISQGNQDDALMALTLSSQPTVPQFRAAVSVYTGGVNPWTARQDAGSMPTNLLGLLLFLAIPAGLLWLAARAAPKSLPHLARADFPFRTIDGTAAPPPPIP